MPNPVSTLPGELPTESEVPAEEVPVPAPVPVAEPPLEGEDEPLKPEDELWPGGPTMAMIDQWKQQFGEDSIYVTSLTPTQHVVWRTLTRFEYRRLVKALETAVNAGTISQAEANMNNEEQVCEVCVLYPQFTRQQIATELAGMPSVISQEVMEASAFVALEVRQL